MSFGTSSSARGKHHHRADLLPKDEFVALHMLNRSRHRRHLSPLTDLPTNLREAVVKRRASKTKIRKPKFTDAWRYAGPTVFEYGRKKTEEVEVGAKDREEEEDREGDEEEMFARDVAAEELYRLFKAREVSFSRETFEKWVIREFGDDVFTPGRLIPADLDARDLDLLEKIRAEKGNGKEKTWQKEMPIVFSTAEKGKKEHTGKTGRKSAPNGAPAETTGELEDWEVVEEDDASEDWEVVGTLWKA